MTSVIANVASGSSENSVDKLRFSITNWQRDCAKLQRESGGGLHGLTGTIAFADQQELELFLSPPRSYDLVLEGDLVQTGYDDVGKLRKPLGLQWMQPALVRKRNLRRRLKWRPLLELSAMSWKNRFNQCKRKLPQSIRICTRSVASMRRSNWKQNGQRWTKNPLLAEGLDVLLSWTFPK